MAPTHDRLKMVTVSTPTTASSSASDDQLMALVSRACSNVDRWNAIHTEQSGIQARMRVGPSANAATATPPQASERILLPSFGWCVTDSSRQLVLGGAPLPVLNHRTCPQYNPSTSHRLGRRELYDRLSPVRRYIDASHEATVEVSRRGPSMWVPSYRPACRACWSEVKGFLETTRKAS